MGARSPTVLFVHGDSRADPDPATYPIFWIAQSTAFRALVAHWAMIRYGGDHLVLDASREIFPYGAFERLSATPVRPDFIFVDRIAETSSDVLSCPGKDIAGVSFPIAKSQSLPPIEIPARRSSQRLPALGSAAACKFIVLLAAAPSEFEIVATPGVPSAGNRDIAWDRPEVGEIVRQAIEAFLGKTLEDGGRARRAGRLVGIGEFDIELFRPISGRLQVAVRSAQSLLRWRTASVEYDYLVYEAVKIYFRRLRDGWGKR